MLHNILCDMMAQMVEWLAADKYRCPSSLISSGPWRLIENPRCALSACIDDIPTSNRTASNLSSEFGNRRPMSEKRPSNGTTCGLNIVNTCVQDSIIRWRTWRKCIAVNGTPPHSYEVSLAIWDHPTQVSTPCLNPSHTRPVLDLHTPEGWKAELT